MGLLIAEAAIREGRKPSRQKRDAGQVSASFGLAGARRIDCLFTFIVFVIQKEQNNT